LAGARIDEMFALAFFNPYLLWGLAGAAIPILIHLFNKRRFRTVAWGAMEFLISSSKMTARRLKIIQALLLLTRIAIVSFLVLALARPFLTSGFLGGALAKSKSSAVIVLDNSYSMGLRNENETCFDVGKKMAGKVVSSFQRGDSLAFILMASRPRVLTEGNPSPERVHRLVVNAELSDERTDILSGLTKGLEILASEKNTRKELFLITDCQKNGWGRGDSARWEKVNQLLSSEKVQPRIFLVDVSRPGEENITVSSIMLPAYPCGVGKKYMVEVSARSSAEKPAGRPVFTLFFDGDKKEIQRAEGSEFKNGISRARLVFSVDEPGFHWGKVIVRADCLDADNARYFSLVARRSVPILCVDGVPSKRRFESGIAYSAYAFAPEKGLEGTHAVSNILDPKVIGVEQFWEEDIGEYEIVVLSNLETISGRMYEELRRFVRDGGGLMIFLGDNVDPVEYSERYGSSADSFLPCEIGSAKGDLPGEDGREGAQNAYRISEVKFGDPVMAPFRNAAGGDLSTAKFYRFFSVEPDVADPDVDVLARFDDGSPYVVSKRFGRGKTILFTSSCDVKWSNLPIKPVFLPLLHRLAYALASGEGETYNLTVGEKVVQKVEGDAASGPLSITDPLGSRFKLLAREPGPSQREEGDKQKPFVSFDDTNRAGVYTLRMPDASTGQLGNGSGEKTLYFSVNVDMEESELSVLDEQSIERLIRWKEFRYLRADEGNVERIEQIRAGKEIWRFLVVAVLCFLVLESALARQINKG